MTGNDDRLGQPGKSRPDSESDLDRRLDSLGRALDAERAERVRAETPRPSGASGYALAVRMGSEFIAGVVVGAALGWGIDSLAGTSPWGLIVFLMLGFVAGVMNVLRSAGRIGTGSGGPRPGR